MISLSHLERGKSLHSLMYMQQATRIPSLSQPHTIKSERKEKCLTITYTTLYILFHGKTISISIIGKFLSSALISYCL